MTQLPQDRHIPPLMSVTEAAAELNMTPQGLRKAASKGQVLGQKVGGTWVFRRALVERVSVRRKEAKESAPIRRENLAARPNPDGRNFGNRTTLPGE